MRRILLFAVCMVLLGSCGKPANQLDGPKGMPSQDKFVVQSMGTLDCGPSMELIFRSDNEAWIKFFVGTSEHPLLVISVVNINNNAVQSIWLDRDRDGRFDERYSSLDNVRAKYPSPCDAVK